MSKLVELDKKYYPLEDYGWYCPGCRSGHQIAVNQKNHSNASWSFNGDFASPTFLRSLHLKINTPDMGKDYQPDIHSTVCHCFIVNGQVQYLGDCTHGLRGQTVPLPDVPDNTYVGMRRL